MNFTISFEFDNYTVFSISDCSGSNVSLLQKASGIEKALGTRDKTQITGLPGTGARRELGMTTNEQGVSFRDDKNVELNSGDDCTTLLIY